MKTASLARLLAFLPLLPLMALPLHAQQTPFYTENWSGSPFPWNDVGAAYQLGGGLLYNASNGSVSQLMYTGSLPYGSNYSIQTQLACGPVGSSATHYLRGGNYQVQANVIDYSGDLSIYIYSGANILGGVGASCGSGTVTIASSITGSSLSVLVNGTTVFSTTDSTYASGGLGVGTSGDVGGGRSANGIGTTVLGATAPAPPNPPTNLTTSQVYAWQVNLSWSPTTGSVTAASYNVYRENPGGTSFSSIASVTSCSTACQFTDPAVSPAQTYHYQVTAVAQNNLESNPDGPISATTPTVSYSAPDAGGPVEYHATWGGGPEQIALLTSELGIRIPLPKFQQGSRGPGAQMMAAWNSQIWSDDSQGGQYVPAGEHFKATDTGYGLGWIFQVAAIYPVMIAGTINHFELQASSGLIRKLYQVGSSTQYKSQDSSYLLWDYSTRKLTFRDGSVWTFGCTSIGVEQDAGTLYPSTLEDANGNLITITYQPGQISSNPAVFSTQTNTSSRIASVQDTLTTYTWTYYTAPSPHAGHVWTVSHGAAPYLDAVFNYSNVVTNNVVSPFCSGTCPQYSYTELTQITYTGSPGPFVFSYNNSAELVKVTFPYQGYFSYDYTTKSFSSGARLAREVTARHMSADGTQGSEQTYTISHPSGDSSNGAHTQATVADPTGNQKVWNFIYGSSNAWDNGLSNQMQTFQGTSQVLRAVNTTWTQDNFSSSSMANPRACTTTTIYDDGQTQSTTETDTDSNGNVIAVRQYAMGWRSSGNGPPASSPCTSPGAGNAAGALYRTTTTAYLSSSAYTALNILNRPTSVTVCAGSAGCSSPVAVTTFAYDTCNLPCTGPTDHPGLVQHDSNYGASFLTRGNAWVVTSNGMAVKTVFDIAGNLLTSTDAMGVRQSTTFNNNSQVTNASGGGNSASVGYNPDLTTQTVTGANSDQSTFGYIAETYRPLQVTNPDYSVTSYSYSDLSQYGGTIPWSYPYMSSVTTPMGKVTQTFLDGFGRTIQVSVKEPNSQWSTTQTTYTTCGCSSTGKATSTSRPFDSQDHSGSAYPPTPVTTPTGPELVYWTTSNNDGLGRPFSVTQPYVQGTNNPPVMTQYTYGTAQDTGSGAYLTTTLITDAYGKLKRYWYEAFGNMIRVDELPANLVGPFTPSNLGETARYTFDVAGHMTLVQMGLTNGSYTQTRTFTYSPYTSSGPWGLLTSATTPEKGTVTYSYYANGTLQSKTDAKNQTLWYAYDSHRRLGGISSGSIQSTAVAVTTFTYDTATNGVGKMATAWNVSGYTWSYSYDVLGNMNGLTLQTPYTDTISNYGTIAVSPSASYAYDSDSRLTGITAPRVDCLRPLLRLRAAHRDLLAGWFFLSIHL